MDQIEILENYLTDLQADEEIAEDGVLKKKDAAEIFTTMIKQKKTYKESMREEKEKELSRGMDFLERGARALAKASEGGEVSSSLGSTRFPLRRSRSALGATIVALWGIGRKNARCQPRVPTPR